MKSNELNLLKNKAAEIRLEILKLVYKLGGGHIGGALSIVEIITVLYYSYLNIHSQDPLNPLRDRFILSKGHSCLTLFYALADRGFFDKKLLDTIALNVDTLGAHPEMNHDWGIEIASGSLGHGLSIGCGIALSSKIMNKNFKTLVLLGDGECQEGSVWEAALFGAHHKLSNLTAIIDYNKLQAIQPINEALEIKPLSDKWRAFGWSVIEINGHSLEELVDTFNKLPFETEKPSVIIAHTIKGKGISYMENTPIWHYRCPNKEEFEKALQELEQKCI